MNKSGAGAVLALAFVMITGLSVMYWRDIGKKLATVSSSADGREVPICSVQTEEKEVALSFEMTAGNEGIQEILDSLAANQVTSTFFVSGSWAEQYPKEVEMILAAGHDLGNCGENHRQMSELSGEECRREIMRLHKTVKKQTGYEMNLFRMPYNDYDDTSLRAVYACGYYPVQWNLDSLDWKDYGKQAILDTVLNHENLGGGAIILLHGSARYTPAALGELIAGLREQGYEIVPVSKLIYKEHYHMDGSGKQIPDPS